MSIELGPLTMALFSFVVGALLAALFASVVKKTL